MTAQAFTRSIVITPGLWGRGVYVGIQPPRVDIPGQAFGDAEAAEAYADRLHRRYNWPVINQLDLPPEAA